MITAPSLAPPILLFSLPIAAATASLISALLPCKKNLQAPPAQMGSRAQGLHLLLTASRCCQGMAAQSGSTTLGTAHMP